MEEEWEDVAVGSAPSADEWEDVRVTPPDTFEDNLLSYVATPGSSDTDKMIGLAKGATTGTLGLATYPLDLISRAGVSALDYLTGDETDTTGVLPSDWIQGGVDWISGGRGDPQTEKAANLTAILPRLMRLPSATRALPQTGSRIANTALKASALGAEGVGINAALQSREENPFEGAGLAAGLNTVIPFAGTGLSKLYQMLSPGAKALSSARGVVGDIQSVIPGALQSTLSQADRAKIIAQGLEDSAGVARKQASGLFDALPGENVVLDDAITAIKQRAAEVGGPITPGSRTSQVISYLDNLKPKDIEIPAGKILDETGTPFIQAQTIPGGPAQVPLNQAQNILRDIGKLQGGAEGADRLILANAKNAVLDAAEKSVSPEASAALKEARSAWSKMASEFDDSAVGKVRDSLDAGGKFNALRNSLMNDAKSAEELVAVMKPSEIKQAQDLMLADVFKLQPVAWEKKLVEKADSFSAVFGKSKTDALIKMVGQDGSVGQKLLQDNEGLKSLFTKMMVRVQIGGALGGKVGEIAALGLQGTGQ